MQKRFRAIYTIHQNITSLLACRKSIDLIEKSEHVNGRSVKDQNRFGPGTDQFAYKRPKESACSSHEQKLFFTSLLYMGSVLRGLCLNTQRHSILGAALSESDLIQKCARRGLNLHLLRHESIAQLTDWEWVSEWVSEYSNNIALSATV